MSIERSFYMKRKRHLFVSNNKVKCYINLLSLPPGYDSIEELSCKPVIYQIITKANKIYIGSTCDFGERMDTHSKNARDKETEMYADMRCYGEYDVDIIAVCDSLEDAKTKEKRIIENYKSNIPKKLLGKSRFLYSKQELNKIIETKLYNIKNN